MPNGNGNVKKKGIKRSIDIHLPIKALSTNKIYEGRKRRSWYYKAFRKKIFKMLDNYDNTHVKLEGNLTLKMQVGFSSVMSDLSNAIKAAEDCISEYFGFNDRQVVRIEMDKYIVDKGDEFIRVCINKTRKNIDRRGGGKTKK